MESREVANKLINKICEKDSMVKKTFQNNELREHVLNDIDKGFKYIVFTYPELVEDIIERIVKYHTDEKIADERKITDFVQLPQWYSWSLEEHDKKWWNPQGRYYGLRMCEVINMFLIARLNGGF